MKLSDRQIDAIIAALRFWQQSAHTEEACTFTEIDELCELINTRDVWAVRPQLIEDVRQKFDEVARLHEEYRTSVGVLVSTMQKRCAHQWRYTSPTRPRTCHVCGKEEK